MFRYLLSFFADWRRTTIDHKQKVKQFRSQGWKIDQSSIVGAYESTVGLVSLGKTSRLLCERLQVMDINIIAHDPFVSKEVEAQYRLTLVSLEEVFKQSDVVSLHTPLLAETHNLIRKDHFLSMRQNASFINTARGKIVNTDEMAEAFIQRPDMTALLDVTEPEPLNEEHPLYDLPNVIITPHLAGSHGQECQRMGRSAIDELKRFLAGEPLKEEIKEDAIHRMA